MKKVGAMDLGSATNYFFAMEEDAPEPMLELTPTQWWTCTSTTKYYSPAFSYKSLSLS
jgi:hypothetical protein